MQHQLRDEHLAQIIEALRRYSDSDNQLTLVSEREADELRIHFTLRNAEAYHTTLQEIMLESQRHERSSSGVR